MDTTIEPTPTTRAALRALDHAALARHATSAARVLAAHGVTLAGDATSWPPWLQVEVVLAAHRRGRPW